MKPEELESKLAQTQLPWAFYRGPKWVQLKEQDYELACAAVNALPHLIELWKADLILAEPVGADPEALVRFYAAEKAHDAALAALEALPSPKES